MLWLLAVLLTAAMFTLKLIGTITVSWLIVFLPIVIMAAVGVAILLVGLIGYGIAVMWFNRKL